MEQLYGTMWVYGSALSAVSKVIIPTMLLSGGIGIVMMTFLSLRNFNMPTFLFLCVSSTALAGSLVMFGQIYEAVCITRASQAIISRMLSAEELDLKLMTKSERDEIMRRAKAFRLVQAPIGDFGYVSMSVFMACCEEILSQVLFLLSL